MKLKLAVFLTAALCCNAAVGGDDGEPHPLGQAPLPPSDKTASLNEAHTAWLIRRADYGCSEVTRQMYRGQEALGSSTTLHLHLVRCPEGEYSYAAVEERDEVFVIDCSELAGLAGERRCSWSVLPSVQPPPARSSDGRPRYGEWHFFDVNLDALEGTVVDAFEGTKYTRTYFAEVRFGPERSRGAVRVKCRKDDQRVGVDFALGGAPRTLSGMSLVYFDTVHSQFYAASQPRRTRVKFNDERPRTLCCLSSDPKMGRFPQILGEPDALAVAKRLAEGAKMTVRFFGDDSSFSNSTRTVEFPQTGQATAIKGLLAACGVVFE